MPPEAATSREMSIYSGLNLLCRTNFAGNEYLPGAISPLQNQLRGKKIPQRAQMTPEAATSREKSIYSGPNDLRRTNFAGKRYLSGPKCPRKRQLGGKRVSIRDQTSSAESTSREKDTSAGPNAPGSSSLVGKEYLFGTKWSPQPQLRGKKIPQRAQIPSDAATWREMSISLRPNSIGTRPKWGSLKTIFCVSLFV